MSGAAKARRDLLALADSWWDRDEWVYDLLIYLDSSAFVSGVEWGDDGAEVPGSDFIEWDPEWDADRLRKAVREVAP